MPASPSPVRRRRWPVAMPAGILTVSLRCLLDRAAARGRSGHGLVITLPAAAALPAGARHREEALLIAQLTGAAALRARRRRGARRRAVPLQVSQVSWRGIWMSSRRPWPTARTRSRGRSGDRRRAADRRGGGPAEHVAEAEDVAEAAEDVLEAREMRRVEAPPDAAGDPGVTEAIVAGALVAVGEHRVGFGRFLELLLGRLVARVAIGMELERQLAIRALDLLIGGGTRRPEDLVVVALAHDALATFTSAGRSSRSPSL